MEANGAIQPGSFSGAHQNMAAPFSLHLVVIENAKGKYNIAWVEFNHTKN